MKSVAIVGLGWLGLPLARYLKSLGFTVKGSRQTHNGVEQMRLLRLDSYYLALTPEIDADPDDLNELLDVDALVITVPPSQYFFDLEQYVQGIQNLVNEALLCGVSHIIYTSSIGVLPKQSGIYDESTVIEPSSDAGRAIAQVEQYLSQLQDIDCDIIRLAGLIGEDRHPIYSLSGRADLKHGNSPVNLVHLDDCIRAIQLLLETPSAQRIYHLCAPQHPSRMEYYTRIAEQLELALPQFICEDNAPNRIVSGQKICQELDFVYQYPDPYQMLKK